VVLGNNSVTVFHAVSADLGLPLPWPVPTEAPQRANDTILIWGGSSSVGQYALQILRHWGYRKLIATGSPKHHELLKSLGAEQVFDYRDPNVVKEIVNAYGDVPLILDCIGSKDGSVAPISKIAKKGSIAAILLPVIVKDSTETEDPVYEMDVSKAAVWAEGVDARGVRTHHYLNVSCIKLILRGLLTECIRTTSSRTISS
jgi:NADPH:quinone reductase-like Zn-dependent oxidoreductase